MRGNRRSPEVRSSLFPEADHGPRPLARPGYATLPYGLPFAFNSAVPLIVVPQGLQEHRRLA